MKGFVISWFFPPINSSEGLVTYKLLKYSKNDYEVFTQKNNESWTYGAKEKELVSNNINTIFSNQENFEKWIDEGVEYFDKNHKKYDFIMSRSMPPESHEMALKIKQKYPNKKWIASFGDPISNNPFLLLCKETSPYTLKGQALEYMPLRYIVSPKRIIKNFIWKYRKFRYEKTDNSQRNHAKIQKDTFENADILIFNNEYQMKYMLNGCSQEIIDKAVIIPHSFDLDFYPSKNVKNDKIKISYVGHLDDIRTPNNFLRAVKRLKKTYPDIENQLLIEFYGNMADKDKLYIINNQLYEFVKMKRSVTYLESLNIMSNSDYLLLIDANLGSILNENIFFAAKIVDYLGSETKILGITMLNGASADILRETNNIICSHSVDEIYMNLKLIIENKIDSKGLYCSKYDAKNVAKQYDNILEEKLMREVK